MTDNNKKDPVGSITISSDHQPKKVSEKKKKEPFSAPKQEIPVSEPGSRAQQKDTARPLRTRKPKHSIKTTSLLFWAVLGVISIFALYSLAGFLVVPYLLRTTLPETLGKKMDRPVTVGNASFNPFTLQCTLNNAIIGPVLSDPEDKVDPLCSVDKLQFSLSLSSFFSKKVIADQVSMDHLFFHLVRTGEKQYNISQLIKKEGVTEKTAEMPAIHFPFPFLLTNISAANSRILFDDLPTGKNHVIEEISLAFPAFFHDRTAEGKSQNVLSKNGTLIKPQFAATINGSPIELSGDTSLSENGIEAKLRLQLNNIDIPAYLGYLPNQQAFTLDKGTAAGEVDLVFLSPNEGKAQLELKGKGKLLNLQFRDKQGNINTLPEVALEGSFTPLGRRYHFSEIKISKPVFHVGRQKDGSWSFPELFRIFSSSQTAEKRTLLSVNLLQINAGSLSFADHFIPDSFSHIVSNLQMTANSISNEKQAPSPYVLSGSTGQNGKIVCQGDLFVNPLRMQGLAIINKLEAGLFSPYMSLAKDVKIAGGIFPKIESRFDLSLPASAEGKPEFIANELGTELIDFTITHKGQQWLSLPKTSLSVEKLNPTKKIIQLKRVEATDPFISFSWDKKGVSNWENLRRKPENGTKTPWDITFAQTEIKNGSIRLHDNTWKTPYIDTLTKVSGKAIGITSQENTSGSISMSGIFADGGAFSADGALSLSPFSASAQCLLDQYPLSKSSTFLKKWLSPSTYSGLLRAEGKAEIPGLTFQGSVEVTDFNAGTTKNAKLMSWKKAHAEDVLFSRPKKTLTVAHAKLDYPYLNWTIDTKPANSYGGIFSREIAKSKEDHHVALRRIEIKSAILDIQDNRLSPALKSTTTLSGTINNIANAPGTIAKLNLKGASSSNSAVSVLGDVGMLQKVFSCDVTSEISGQDVGAIKPYLEKTVGYEITKGKFDALIRYRQKDAKVTGTHSIVLSDIALGKSRSSANQFPLTLALLTDKKRTLKIDLPITRDETSQEYSYPDAITRSLQNLILKSTVSPFALALAGNPAIKEAPDHIVFTAGETSLSPENEKTLKNLQTLLTERPGLTVHIKGYASAEEDREALLAQKENIVDRRQQALDQVRSTILSESYGKELIQPVHTPSHAAIPMTTPRKPVVKNEELTDLAQNREKAIKDFMTTTLKISADRLTPDNTGTIIPADAPGRIGNRADFTLGAR